jgi:hypothetical protein
VSSKKYQIKEKIFKWTGKGAWFFIRIDEKISEDIRDNFGILAKGWGSIPVNVIVRNSNWKTSIFPDKGTYLLPVKAKIRKEEKINEEDLVSFQIEIDVDSV